MCTCSDKGFHIESIEIVSRQKRKTKDAVKRLFLNIDVNNHTGDNRNRTKTDVLC